MEEPLHREGILLRYNNATIQNNLFFANNYGIQTDGIGTIDGNTIVNNVYGVDGGDPIVNNIIANNSVGVVGGSTIEGNLIVDNRLGLSGGIQIRNNTIVNNTLGIQSGFSTLVYNNIYGNGLNVNFTSSTDANATYNWWGTTDTDKISQTIFDYKNDFRLGRVNFVPILTAPNSAAPSEITPIPVIPEFPTLIILPMFITATLALVVYFRKRKR